MTQVKIIAPDERQSDSTEIEGKAAWMGRGGGGGRRAGGGGPPPPPTRPRTGERHRLTPGTPKNLFLDPPPPPPNKYPCYANRLHSENRPVIALFISQNRVTWGLPWALNSTEMVKTGPQFFLWGKQGSRREKLNSHSQFRVPDTLNKTESRCYLRGQLWPVVYLTKERLGSSKY